MRQTCRENTERMFDSFISFNFAYTGIDLLMAMLWTKQWLYLEFCIVEKNVMRWPYHFNAQSTNNLCQIKLSSKIWLFRTILLCLSNLISNDILFSVNFANAKSTVPHNHRTHKHTHTRTKNEKKASLNNRQSVQATDNPENKFNQRSFNKICLRRITIYVSPVGSKTYTRDQCCPATWIYGFYIGLNWNT